MSCADYMPVKADYSPAGIPPAPDYAKEENWSALPDMEDFGDHIPGNSVIPLHDGQDTASVDVFYIHPTTFFSRTEWNASLDDEKVNVSTDARAVKNQASVFNGSCRVFAPRYRQATFNAYFSLDDTDAVKAFKLAYSDIREAFIYYLEHYNNGRPIIIASHSQGTTHAKWLLQEFFDGTPLQDQLVCAYILGMPVYDSDFVHIAPSDSATQVGCYVSWRSFLKGTEPKEKLQAKDKEHIVCINPLTFNRDTAYASSELNAGGLGRDGETIFPHVCGAQIHDDIIWVDRPDIPGKIFIPKNLHPADYNLYWLQIRENVAARIQAYYEALPAGGRH
ncbi:MAG: DUF3089 domain-containing protein [Chitinophagales bacterium]